MPLTNDLVGKCEDDEHCHVIWYARVGAAGLGDIGSHFPDTDPRYRNADSMVLLARVVLLVSEGHVLLNVDSTIHAERPKMAPHIPAMRGRSEEHTSELQSQAYLGCRLLLEKKKQLHPLCFP